MGVEIKVTKDRDLISKCDVCGQKYHNWWGSTPCCGSMATILTEIDFRNDKLNKITNNINESN